MIEQIYEHGIESLEVLDQEEVTMMIVIMLGLMM